MARTNLSDFRILPGVAEAARLLKEAGFLLIIVTNQPDVANGLTPKATVEAMHAEIMRQLPIDDIIVCFHADADNCSCRKPQPGMILETAARHKIDLAASYLVGDRLARRARRAQRRLPHDLCRLRLSAGPAPSTGQAGPFAARGGGFYSKGRRAALTHKLPFLPHPRTRPVICSPPLWCSVLAIPSSYLIENAIDRRLLDEEFS